MSASPAPWLVDRRPELWVRPAFFGRIIQRSTRRVYQMLVDGTISRDFGYPTYKDVLGAWYIRVTELDYELGRALKSQARRKSA